MLTNKDLHKDITELEKVRNNPKATAEEIDKAQLKAEILILKLLHSIRTNTVAVMRKFGVDLVKPSREGKSEKELSSETK